MNIFLLEYERGTSLGKLKLSLNIICSLVIITCIIPFEIIQATNERWNYLTDILNWNDIAFILVFLIYVTKNAIQDTVKEDGKVYETTRIILSVLIYTGFIKFIGLFRVNDNVVFIARMFIKVIFSIIPFLALFTALVIVFSFIVYALGLDLTSMGDENPYRTIGSLGYFIYVFRTSTGDFDVDQFSQKTISL